MIVCQGKFDGLHAGHVRYLQAARQLSTGETLRVLIAPDRYIEQTRNRPAFWSQADRAHTVYALACVDAVTLQQTDDGAEDIRALQPRLYVKGPDWVGRLPASVVAACQDVGAEIVFTHTAGRHAREARR